MESLNILSNMAVIAAAYLAGGIPFCYLIAKFVSGKDLRKIGEKNPGSVNLMFNVSKTLCVLGGILDFAKGFLAYYLSLRITDSQTIAVLAGSGAVLGHNYSPYLKLRGGKGMATTLGVLFAANPFSIVTFGALFISFLFLFKNIIWSILFSMAGACIFIYLLDRSPLYLVLMVLLAIMVIPKYTTFSRHFWKDFTINRGMSLKDLLYEKDKYNKS